MQQHPERFLSKDECFSFMKALSLKQPFAELILSGKKTVETRTWNTKFRGEFYIHASKIPDEKAMKRFGFSELPTGVVVGTAELVDVIEYDEKNWKKDKRTCAEWMPYRKYGFVLKNVKRIKTFEAKGKLGFFNLHQGSQETQRIRHPKAQHQ